MKRACITTISFAILVLGIIGCTSSAPTTVTPADVPSLSKNEVCAIVYNYLQSEIQGLTFIGVSQGLQNAISNARSSCSTTYVGEGQWSVNALGYGYYSEEEKWYFYHTGGRWNVYETSRITEPSNTQANNLLEYIWNPIYRR